MNPSREIVRSVAGLLAALVAMMIAIVVLGMYVERSIPTESNVFPVAIPWEAMSLRWALPFACGVGT